MNSRRTTRAAAAVAVSVAAFAAAGAASAAPPQPVPSLELDRYLGVWRQLAAVPQPFNLECARDTTAEYTLDARGDIAVHNRCTTWTGGTSEIRGTARVNDPVTRAQLHVSFPGVPSQDQLDGPTNYIVTALGPDYSWALVTDPSRLSGFVLSRTPALDENAWAAVDAAISANGQNSCLFLTTPATGGQSALQPLCTR
ncbi:lipocalin family protein [Nocardia puris]|uniref:Apolipoprotein D and lipocalin family protein n=1 Tax=Nocardia puris TaxID=208602 RepID=A0A366DR35_9NOCA|nr:lipocalin family protein [Nocardia puris]MBF6214135.1 lipocalin family protein [Nocardia puris]MBF6365375.1 lipocalin family protein [Nocardia puris]MBF6459777.1 lipocalin family protein [Nocardia puris]RBO91678.1 apolipoprotein D and lipocalin family protein [Nocardia puris]